MAKAYIQNQKVPQAVVLPLKINQFQGGLNNVDSVLILEDNESPDLQNVIFTEKGLLSKRHGHDKLYNILFTANPKRIFIYEKRDGSKYYLICTDTKLYRINDAHTALTEIQTVTKVIDGLTYADKFLFVNGAGYFEYDGTTVTAINNASYVPTAGELADPFKGANSIPTDCTMIAVRDERIYLSGSTLTPNAVYHTALNNHKYVPANGFVPSLTNDNNKVTALKMFMDALIIFKEDSVHVLYGNDPDVVNSVDPFRLKRISAISGTIAPKSVAQVENFLYYLGTNGKVYSLAPIKTDVDYLSVKDMSTKIDLFKAPISVASIDLSNACGIYFEGNYYLAIASKIVLVFNFKYQAWTLWNNLEVTSFIEDDYKLLFASTRKYIYKFNKTLYNDDGEAIESYCYTKGYDFGQAHKLKQFRKIFAIAKTFAAYDSSIKLTFLIDFIEVTQNFSLKSNLSVWGKSVWGDKFVNTELAKSEPINVNVRGKVLQIKIENNILNETFTIFEINGLTEIRQST